MRLAHLLAGSFLALAATASIAPAQSLRSAQNWIARSVRPTENYVEAQRLNRGAAALGSSRIARLGAPLQRPEGLSTGIFKVYDVAVLDPVTSAEVKKLRTGVIYDIVAVVEVPFAATFPWTWQIEYGKAQFLEFLVEEDAFPSAGVFFVSNTLELGTTGPWGVGFCLGGNRTKTAKVKVI
ncbi:MAG: hypothetical protein JNM84_18545 [Planctomycetes bacterium]|nr:hypothetical protein [Planctomycetota bacterium]